MLECVVKVIFIQKIEGNVGRVVDSVYIVMFSLEPDCVLVKGYIIWNIVVFVLVYCSKLDRRIEYR